jgi:hypothetical protein
MLNHGLPRVAFGTINKISVIDLACKASKVHAAEVGPVRIACKLINSFMRGAK